MTLNWAAQNISKTVLACIIERALTFVQRRIRCRDTRIRVDRPRKERRPDYLLAAQVHNRHVSGAGMPDFDRDVEWDVLARREEVCVVELCKRD